MSDRPEQPRDRISSWHVKRGFHELEDIDEMINDDIQLQYSRGYRYVGMTVIPQGKKESVLCLHFRLEEE